MTITTTQAAKELDISTSRVRQLIRAGKLVASKHGRDWSIDSKSFDSFVKVQRRPGRPRKSKT